jgi:SAM-dependent methyltransferase
MNLIDIIQRSNPPQPWAEGEKIPWNEPGFSRRMLKEHLSQEHDAASRRSDLIDRHVDWIHTNVLQQRPSRILDLGCGPGLYTSRLARLGHTCRGIDFSLASIEYARQVAEQEQLSCTYELADIRKARFGSNNNLVMLVFGEFNVFRPDEANLLVKKAAASLAPGGCLLLELHPYETVEKLGRGSSSWYTAETGLFGEYPHLGLQENYWDGGHHVAINRWYVINALTGEVLRHSASNQAYTHQELIDIFTQSGFESYEQFPSLTGLPDDNSYDLSVYLARQ